jgi:hypothetical protein
MQKIQFLPLEDARNSFHGNIANTAMHKVTELFIDNPYLATQIWAELPRKNRWQF